MSYMSCSVFKVPKTFYIYLVAIRRSFRTPIAPQLAKLISSLSHLVDPRGVEPLTFAVQMQRSTN